MTVYSIIMFAATIVFAVFAMLISKGNTNLINCYHEERTPNKQVYCKKIGQALWLMATVLAVSGVMGLFGETDDIALAVVGVLIVGIISGLCVLFCVQKKYGGGVF